MTYVRVAAWALLVCWQATLAATSYPPVSFDQLIARADVIFVGEVVDVRPFALATREGTVIKTRVTFRVADPLLGSSGAFEILEFLGGEWEGVGMAIAGMPRFAAGDRRVVFARRERSINPIVGFTHGLLQVARDGSGVERVLTADGGAVSRPESIGALRQDAPGSPMTLAAFRERVRAALIEARRR